MSRLIVGNSNKQPVQEPTIMLPPEILNFICGVLGKEDLKQVRQVSKIWERAAVPYLFDEIFISQDLADFRIAKLVILHFKHYIRTLVWILSKRLYEFLAFSAIRIIRHECQCQRVDHGA